MREVINLKLQFVTSNLRNERVYRDIRYLLYVYNVGKDNRSKETFHLKRYMV